MTDDERETLVNAVCEAMPHRPTAIAVADDLAYAVEAILTAREGEWRGTEAVLRGEIRRSEAGIAAYDELTARLAKVEALADEWAGEVQAVELRAPLLGEGKDQDIAYGWLTGVRQNTADLRARAAALRAALPEALDG